MKNRPYNWKLVYGANVLIAVLILPLVIYISFLVVYKSEKWETVNFLYAAFALLILTVIISNSVLNLHIIRKFYPSKPLSRNIDKLSTGLFFANIVLWFLLTLIFAFMIRDYLSDDFKHSLNELVTLLTLCLFLGIQIFVLVMQIKLPGIVQLHHKNELSRMINTIGDRQND